jgi:hypothetical protein
MSPFARIVAAIAGLSSEPLKVEQKVEQNLLGKFSRPFTQREPPLGGDACRVSPSKEEAIWFLA